jgi:hypothetical protein
MYREGNIMTTRASQNGTGAAEMEFEAAHYSSPEMEEEWEEEAYSNPEGYSTPEMEEEWEAHETSQYSNPSSHPEMEWETHETSHYSNPYSNPELEWETHESSHYSNPEMEWEAHETSHYSHPELEWETHETSHYSQPYSNPYSNPELEWETHEASHSNPYSNPEMEADRFFPLIAKAAKLVLPHAKRLAMRVGRNILSRMRQPSSGRNQQIAALMRQLQQVLAQGESEAATHEAHLFGANEFEAEVAAHEAAHHAALTEVMAAEASHTESESEAQALLGAALPISIRVMGGRIALRRITPSLVRVNAQLVLSLHRQGSPGRQLLRAVPSIQRRTISSLKAISQSGQAITPAIAAQVMAGQAARVLSTPKICGRALVRNMVIRKNTVAPRSSVSSPVGQRAGA